MDGIPTFKFNYPNNIAYKTFLTQEMLAKKIFATNAVYLSYCHDTKLIKEYTYNLDRIFKTIKKFTENDLNILDYLKGPISQLGLRQKR